MAELTRREFFRLSAAATAAGAAVGGSVMWVDPEKALALDPDNEEVFYNMCAECNHVPYCGSKVIVNEGEVVRLEKREDFPNNRMCAKGVAQVQALSAPDRLLHPMKRTNPKGQPAEWKQITWEEANELMASKFNEIKEREGAEKVMFMTGDPKEPRPIVQRLAYIFGSPNFGTESSTCYNATELSSQTLYGKSGPAARSLAIFSKPDPEETRTLIFWGANLAWSVATALEPMRQLKKNAKDIRFIIVDPRKTPTARDLADVHLQIRPGTDGALALGICNYMIQNDAYDKEFVDKWVKGFDEFAEYVSAFTVEKTAEITQLDTSIITEAFETICRGGKAGPLINRSSAQFPHHTNGVPTYRAIKCIEILSGSIDVPGGPHIADGPLPVDLFSGVREWTGVDTLLPQLADKRVDTKYFPIWSALDNHGSVQLNRLPEYVEEGAIKACFAMGINAMMWSDTEKFQKAFNDMEFAVAADFHIRPWTHDNFDLLLPAAMPLERCGGWFISGRNIFIRQRAIKPKGEARSDWRICCDLGCALGFEEEFYGGGDDSDQKCLDAQAQLLGTSFEALNAAVPGPVAIPPTAEPAMKKYESGALRPDGEPGFTTPSGKIEIYSDLLKEHGFEPLPVYEEPVLSPLSTPDVAEEFPLVLNTGSRVPFYTHSKHRDVPWLRQLMPDPVVGIYPSDAEDRGIKQGDDVILSSPLGEIKVKANVTRLVRPGVIDMFHGWEQANVNEIISREYDPISGFPPFKEGLCEVKKA